MRHLYEASQGLGWLSKKEKFGLMVRAVGCSAGRQMFDPTSQSFISFNWGRPKRGETETYLPQSACIETKNVQKVIRAFWCKANSMHSDFPMQQNTEMLQQSLQSQTCSSLCMKQWAACRRILALGENTRACNSQKYTTAYKSTVFI